MPKLSCLIVLWDLAGFALHLALLCHYSTPHFTLINTICNRFEPPKGCMKFTELCQSGSKPLKLGRAGARALLFFV